MEVIVTAKKISPMSSGIHERDKLSAKTGQVQSVLHE